LKLLFDEMYPPAIAEQLCGRGHDVEGVTDRPELRALSDEELFGLALQERRAIVTENVDDFSVIADGYDRRGQLHHGIVFVNPGRFFRGDPRTIGRMVTALHDLLAKHASEEPASLRHWL
jgi:hypothetical protein